jgi:hypothetical protein
MSGDRQLRVVTVGRWPSDVLVAACDRARAVVVGSLGARAAGLDPTSRWPSATELIVNAHPDRVLATGPHAIDAAVTALDVYRVPVFLLEPPTVHEARRLGGLALAGGAHSALFDPLSEQLRGAFDILRAGEMGRLRRVVLECGPAGDPDAGHFIRIALYRLRLAVQPLLDEVGGRRVWWAVPPSAADARLSVDERGMPDEVTVDYHVRRGDWSGTVFTAITERGTLTVETPHDMNSVGAAWTEIGGAREVLVPPPSTATVLVSQLAAFLVGDGVSGSHRSHLIDTARRTEKAAQVATTFREVDR